MSSIKVKARRLLLILAPIVLALTIFALMVSRKQPPKRKAETVQLKTVRVLTLREFRFQPQATAHGVARPVHVWQARPEVSGKILSLNPLFKEGALLEKDTWLIRIDPSEFYLIEKKRRAQIRASEAALVSLVQEEKTLTANLNLERQNLGLIERNLRRNLELVRSGSIATSVMEQVERDRLRQKLQISNLENNLKLIPFKRNQAKAQLEQAEIALQDAQRRVNLTEIRLPFSGRIARKEAELGQAVQVGTVLAELHGVNELEIKANLAFEQFQTLFSNAGNVERPQFLDGASAKLTSTVAVAQQPNGLQWKATVRHLSPFLDPKTRALGIYLIVDPSEMVRQNTGRQALVNGMYCEATLKGPAKSGILVPRSALHGDQVWTVDSLDRLEIRTVQTGSRLKEFVEIVQGLFAGDRIVLSDFSPAVQGLHLAPIEDEEIGIKLNQVALGEASND